MNLGNTFCTEIFYGFAAACSFFNLYNADRSARCLHAPANRFARHRTRCFRALNVAARKLDGPDDGRFNASLMKTSVFMLIAAGHSL